MEPNSAVEQFSNIINTYLQEHPKISVNYLATKCQVSEASLRRIVKLQTKVMPNITFTRKVLAKVCGLKNHREFINSFDGPLREFLVSQMNFTEMSSSQQKFVQELQNQVEDPLTFHILALTGCKVGVSEEQVEAFFGVEGLKILFALFEADYVYIEDGVFHSSEKGVTFNRTIIKPVIQKACELIDVDGVAISQDNFFYLWSESLNRGAIEKIRRLEQQHYKDLREIINNPNSIGDKHIFFFGAFDSYEKGGLRRE